MAIEATKRYHDRMTIAMARFIARRAVEDKIRCQGGKVAHYSARELIERADTYIEAHRDQIMREVVMRRWERWFEKMREKGSAKVAFRKPHGMGFFKALFIGE
jgi:hypothetical protein